LKCDQRRYSYNATFLGFQFFASVRDHKCIDAGSQTHRRNGGSKMSQPTIVRKSERRWIAHVATFIAAVFGMCSVAVSANSADLYPPYEAYPAPQYQPPPNYSYVASPNCGQCGCAPCGCVQCGCVQCGCGPCAVSVQPPPPVVIERRIV